MVLVLFAVPRADAAPKWQEVADRIAQMVDQAVSVYETGDYEGARDLVNEPPNRLTPQTFTQRARAVADDAGLDIEILDEALLREQGFGGIVGVGQGSVHPPFLVRVSWVPENPAQRIALIGKGITFDSGGLSLKPPASMPEMKSDMAGAATVLGVVLAAARQTQAGASSGTSS